MRELSGRHLYIRPTKALMSAFVVLVLFRIPRTLLGVPYIYSIHYSTRSLANQGELFGITFFEVVAIVIGILLYTQKRQQQIRYWLLLIVVFIVNVFRLIFGLSNPFSLESYEIMLSLLTALSCGSIVLYYYDTADDISLFLNITVALFFLSQLYLVATGGGRNGSYGCLGLPGGGLALCYSTYILLRITVGPKSKIETGLLFCAIIGLVLTGSRTNLLLTAVFIIFYVAFVMPVSNSKKWLFAGLLLVGMVVLFFTEDAITIVTSSKKINSLMTIFSTGLSSYITEDASALERINTWRAGIEVIKDNPLGISCSVVDLQTRMYAAGSTTFPHSFLMAYYLLLGIPALFFYIAYWRILVGSRKYKTKLTLLLVYIVFLLTLYGGISTQYLLLFWLFMLYAYSIRTISAQRQDI